MNAIERILQRAANQEEVSAMKKDAIRVSLCGGEKCCPEVVVETATQQVRIGEKNNLVTLDKQAWNPLVEKIKTGELTQL